MPREFPSKADGDAYIAQRISAPCFICEIVDGGARRDAHRIVHEDAETIVFLSAIPTQYGHLLVCPKPHVEQIFTDLSLKAYLHLQRVAWAVGRAATDVLAPERTYLASFGSQQVNRHVHLHIVPLPAGIPIREQQMAAMLPETVGVVQLEPQERDELAQRLRAAIPRHL